MNIYIIYLTENKINGRLYIGSHLCKNTISDSYLGSGKIIKQAISKYGKENFKRKTLEIVLETKNKLSNKEWYDIVLPVETKWIQYYIQRGNNLYNINKDNAFGGNTTQNRIWINNGTISKMIPIENSIPDGWELGRKETFNNVGNKNMKIYTHKTTNIEKSFSKDPGEDWQIGSLKTKEARKGSSNPAFGKKWLKNDFTEQTAYLKDKELITALLEKGWTYGTCQKYQSVKF